LWRPDAESSIHRGDPKPDSYINPQNAQARVRRLYFGRYLPEPCRHQGAWDLDAITAAQTEFFHGEKYERDNTDNTGAK
jgi:hypothetical protein